VHLSIELNEEESKAWRSRGPQETVFCKSVNDLAQRLVDRTGLAVGIVGYRGGVVGRLHFFPAPFSHPTALEIGCAQVLEALEKIAPIEKTETKTNAAGKVKP
jgi:hypothetical protein